MPKTSGKFTPTNYEQVTARTDGSRLSSNSKSSTGAASAAAAPRTRCWLAARTPEAESDRAAIWDNWRFFAEESWANWDCSAAASSSTLGGRVHSTPSSPDSKALSSWTRLLGCRLPAPPDRPRPAELTAPLPVRLVLEGDRANGSDEARIGTRSLSGESALRLTDPDPRREGEAESISPTDAD